MKTIIFLSLAFLFSCSGGGKLNSEIEKAIKENAHNPGSYEAIETTIIDTITCLDNLNFMLRNDSNYTFLSNERRIKDSLIKSPNPNVIASFLVLHKFRIKNEFNALVLNEYYFEMKPDLTVGNFYSTDNMGERINIPGGYPGQSGWR